MRAVFFCMLLSGVGAALFVSPPAGPVAEPTQSYLGFDRNDYPGDEALPLLRKTFAFTSYWLGPPPFEKQSSWLGHRGALERLGFGFLVLFNGRESRRLKSVADAREKGLRDGEQAAKLARQEDFPEGMVVFLDIEEGGRLPAPYHEYVAAWIDTLAKFGYRAGVYCSSMPVEEGQGIRITTAEDLQSHLGTRTLIFWVYNDACPPSPGCAFPENPPVAKAGGFSSAAVWQYAQSPRRKEFTEACQAKYAPDGNCYAPGDRAGRWFLDANVATSPDPSSGR